MVFSLSGRLFLSENSPRSRDSISWRARRSRTWTSDPVRLVASWRLSELVAVVRTDPFRRTVLRRQHHARSLRASSSGPINKSDFFLTDKLAKKITFRRVGCSHNLCQVTLFTETFKNNVRKTNSKDRIQLDSFTRDVRDHHSLYNERYTQRGAWMSTDAPWNKRGSPRVWNPTSLPGWFWHASLGSASWFPRFFASENQWLSRRPVSRFGGRFSDSSRNKSVSDLASVSRYRGLKRARQIRFE